MEERPAARSAVTRPEAALPRDRPEATRRSSDVGEEEPAVMTDPVETTDVAPPPTNGPTTTFEEVKGAVTPSPVESSGEAGRSTNSPLVGIRSGHEHEGFPLPNDESTAAPRQPSSRTTTPPPPSPPDDDDDAVDPDASIASTATATTNFADVIELLDSSDDEHDSAPTPGLGVTSFHNNNNNTTILSVDASTKKRRLDEEPSSSGALASHQARSVHAPDWVKQRMLVSSSTTGTTGRNTTVDPSTGMSISSSSSVLEGHGRIPSIVVGDGDGEGASAATPGFNPLGGYQPSLPPPPPTLVANQPRYVDFPEHFTPDWKQMLPSPPRKPAPNQRAAALAGQPKIYQLSLLNVNEFTIEGVSPRWDMPASQVSGLRVPIRQMSRQHGKSVYERDKDGSGGGKWRIPLGAYHDFAAYLQSDRTTKVLGIPPNQLQIASLERARQDKGYPTPEQIMEYGVPQGLAHKLAPFQRGGVEFVKEKGGRALIADDMGLGKTIQGVASMSMYHTEWPVLILCPSGARYHWESEFKQWLGIYAEVNKKERNPFDKMFPDSRKTAASTGKGPLLHDRQINVLTSSKSAIFPHDDTKVVICSYGLSSSLIEGSKITKGMFRCAIVDESHMLKNKATKRTSLLLPVLHATDRCVLLSGTPALARPVELWPQLSILGTEQHGWGSDEQDFIDKYVKNGNSRRSAELHTMLRGTVMIRRLKDDILKDMPRKIRMKTEMNAMSSTKQRAEFLNLMSDLREGKGALGKLARIHQAELDRETTKQDQFASFDVKPELKEDSNASPNPQRENAVNDLHSEMSVHLNEGLKRIHATVAEQGSHLTTEQQDSVLLQLEGQMRADVGQTFAQRLAEINTQYSSSSAQRRNAEGNEAGDTRRNTLLCRLYGLTGEVKIPFIVESLDRFLQDRTKGKICIFAHHISVLNAIQEGAGLSNEGKSGRRFIRIDGSTLPRARQDQIVAFQSDPSIRVALLGITAAGVAVTLTASATVWFAELFWTPAIMIQAEDRCHRIGQASQVRCLYFVAKGTLDDVLWKLLEKKFRDLGEFVEGMEKLKLVVDKTYKSFKEFEAQTFDNVYEPGSDDGGDDDDSDFDEELQLDSDLVHDIEELGEEERRMLRQAEPDADDADGEPPSVDLDTKLPAREPESTDVVGLGMSEVDAIALSDDEGDDTPHASTSEDVTIKANGSVKPETTPEAYFNATPKERLSDAGLLIGSRVYGIVINEPSLGVDIAVVDGRIVVARVSQTRAERFGPDSKPSVGDILISIGGHSLDSVQNHHDTLRYLKASMKRGPVELMFLDAPQFAIRYKAQSLKSLPAPAAGKRSHDQQPMNSSSSPPDANSLCSEDVIDLLD